MTHPLDDTELVDALKRRGWLSPTALARLETHVAGDTKTGAELAREAQHTAKEKGITFAAALEQLSIHRDYSFEFAAGREPTTGREFLAAAHDLMAKDRSLDFTAAADRVSRQLA